MESKNCEESGSGSSGEGDYVVSPGLQNHAVVGIMSGFVWKFHKAMAEIKHGNLAYAPLQVSAGVFAMLHGANGTTRDELLSILKAERVKIDLAADFGNLLEDLSLVESQGANNNNDDVDLKENEENKVLYNSSQRLFHAPGDSLQNKYIKDIQSHFGIDVQPVDFTGSVGAIRKLRMWLETTGLAKFDTSILKDVAKLDALTRLLFVSTLQFSGSLNLELQFSRQDCFFYVNSNKRVSMQMLCAETEMTFAVIQKLDARAVSIPYEGNKFSLLIFLPRGKPGIGQLEYNLRGYRNAREIIQEFKSKRKLYFRMPHFKIEKSVNFNDVLKSMGATAMFDPNTANFSKLEEYPEDVFISGMIQTVNFDVHEKQKSDLHLQEGTFDLKLKKCEDSLEFLVEHPFFFMVVSNYSDQVVVAGRISNPLDK